MGAVKKVRTRSPDTALVAKRRREIVLVSAAVFMKKGYDRTNVRELSSALGMTKGGLYHYIGSKDDMLGALQARVFGKTRLSTGDKL